MKYSVFAPDDVSAVEADLGRLWRENLPIGADELRQRVRWYYEGNPAGRGSVQLLMADGDPHAVGCSGVGPRQFLVAGNVKKVALLADFAVSKEHRTLQPALLLQRAMMDHCRKTYPFVYGFPNHRAEGVVKRVGYSQLGQMARYACVLRHATYLRTLVSQPLVASALSIGADWTLQGVRTLTAISRQKQLEVVEEEDFDASFDAMWERGSGLYGVCCVRSSEFLKWRYRFGKQPKRWLLGLRSKTDHMLHGYMVVLPEGKVAHLTDFYADSDEHLEQLFVGVLAELYRRQMYSASLSFLGTVRVRSMLSRVGFSLRDSSRTICIDVGESAASQRGFVTDRENWFITDGDEDA